MVGVEAQCNGLPALFSDTITREVSGEYSKFISLKESISVWAKEAIELAHESIDRTEGINLISKMGFNINKETEKLCLKYKMITEEI